MTQQLEVPRVSPYSTIGTDVTGSSTARDALIAGGLDWTVEKVPLYGKAIVEDGVTDVPLDWKVMTVKRMPDGTVAKGLGTVGKDYEVIQNMDVAVFLQNIADISGAQFRNAGSYYDDARVFVQMELPEDVMIAGHDPVNLSLAAFTAHDGGGALTIIPTATRIFCNNQLPGLRRGALAKIVIPHRAGALRHIETARRALGLSFKVTEEFKEVGDWLYAQPFSTNEFVGLVNRVYEPTLNKKGLENVSVITRREALTGLFTTAATQESGRFTKWAAYNAIAEYADWFSPVATRLHGSAATAARATRIVAGVADAPKVRAMALLTR